VIVGPTGAGKSSLALALADARPGTEIISVDSMQVYRGMDIGTAKPTADEQARVRHHCIDLVEPACEFTVVDYQRVAGAARATIDARGARPLYVGGTGLYVRAVVDALTPPGRYPEVVASLEGETDTVALHHRLAGLDPVAASRMEPTNRRRIVRALEVTIGAGRPFSSFGAGLEQYEADAPYRLIGVDCPTDVLDARIEQRYADQMASRFLEEVAGLLERPGGLGRTAAQALGYKELAAHLRGEVSLDGALDLAVRRTRRFARRQRSWFRRDPRIRWLTHDGNPVAVLDDLLGEWDK
jgi:tRNA dimethylallyltransferase